MKALPACVAGDNAKAKLYTKKTDEVEGNCKDFNKPPELYSQPQCVIGEAFNQI